MVSRNFHYNYPGLSLPRLHRSSSTTELCNPSLNKYRNKSPVGIQTPDPRVGSETYIKGDNKGSDNARDGASEDGDSDCS